MNYVLIIGAALLCVFLALVLAFWYAPFYVLNRSKLHPDVRKFAAGSIREAYWPFTVRTLIGFTAYLMVPILVRLTPWEADKLRFFDRIYGNNHGINGDKFVWANGQSWGVPTADLPYVRELCYYCPGEHPRSMKARTAWLLRNRCSKLAIRWGKPWPDQQFQGETVRLRKFLYGDVATLDGLPGVAMLIEGEAVQLVVRKPLGKRNYYAVWGWKLGVSRDPTYVNAPATYKSFGLQTPPTQAQIDAAQSTMTAETRQERSRVERVGEI